MLTSQCKDSTWKYDRDPGIDLYGAAANVPAAFTIIRTAEKSLGIALWKNGHN
jgi:hypothetical protein